MTLEVAPLSRSRVLATETALTCERKAWRSAPEMASVQPEPACAPGATSREVRRPGVLAPDWEALPMPRRARYAAIRLV